MAQTRVALLGLGIMGGGMARRILGAGFPLAVYNRSRAKADALGAEGARVAASPREAAEDADVILSMVPDDRASREVWLGDHGALASAKRGAVAIESSTLTVDWVLELAAAAAARGVEFLDAPVTGSKVQAAAGEMNFLVGGSAAALEKARPVLAVMSKNVIPLGPTGSGALMKLINNFMAGVQVSALAEAVAMIERGGLDRTQAVTILTEGAPSSPLVKTVAPRMTTPDFTPNFYAKLMAKDLGYAIEQGRRLGVPLATAEAALGIFRRAVDAGFGEQDISVVVEPLRAR